jgi:hypothetical protein
MTNKTDIKDDDKAFAGIGPAKTRDERDADEQVLFDELGIAPYEIKRDGQVWVVTREGVQLKAEWLAEQKANAAQ